MTEFDWNVPSAPVLSVARARLFTVLQGPDIAEKVAAFYNPAMNWAGRSFDLLPPVHSEEIAPSDLVAVTLMDVAVRPAAVRRLLTPGRTSEAISAALREVPSNTSLRDADGAVLDAAATLYEKLKAALLGNKWVTASKLAARKRPALIPVRDRVVAQQLGLGNRDFREDWAIFRALVQDDEVEAQLDRLAHEATRLGAPLEDLPTLRILDTAIWMGARPLNAAAPTDDGDE